MRTSLIVSATHLSPCGNRHQRRPPLRLQQLLSFTLDLRYFHCCQPDKFVLWKVAHSLALSIEVVALLHLRPQRVRILWRSLWATFWRSAGCRTGFPSFVWIVKTILDDFAGFLVVLILQAVLTITIRDFRMQQDQPDAAAEFPNISPSLGGCFASGFGSFNAKPRTMLYSFENNSG